MRTTAHCPLGVALLVAAAAHAQESVPRAEPGSSAPKGEVLEWTSPQGQPFWYRVPDGLSDKRPANLLLMLHGTGVPHGWAFWNYPIAKGDWRENDLIVAPEGMTPGNGDSFNFVQGKKDGEQIAALIRMFRERYPIDRVFLYGHSQGAFFCYWFAGEHPELIDGIVAHAGNVLSVRHPDLAKEKVAIGILHGRADAVVPVECAERTDAIYREQGYRHVRLEIVEGLTERSGHWPLPVQVDEMLDWLDRVTVRSPALSLRATLGLARAEKPDLAAIVSGLRDGESLLRDASREEREASEPLAAAVAELVAAVRASHALALGGVDVRAKEPPPESGDARLACVVFAEDDEWRREASSLQRMAQSHDKRVARALEELGDEPDARSISRAAKALSEQWLGRDHDALRIRLAKCLEKPPRGIDAEDEAELRELLTRLEQLAKDGRERFEKRTAKAVTAFVDENSERLDALLAEDGDK